MTDAELSELEAVTNKAVDAYRKWRASPLGMDDYEAYLEGTQDFRLIQMAFKVQALLSEVRQVRAALLKVRATARHRIGLSDSDGGWALIDTLCTEALAQADPVRTPDSPSGTREEGGENYQ